MITFTQTFTNKNYKKRQLYILELTPLSNVYVHMCIHAHWSGVCSCLQVCASLGISPKLELEKLTQPNQYKFHRQLIEITTPNSSHFAGQPVSNVKVSVFIFPCNILQRIFVFNSLSKPLEFMNHIDLDTSDVFMLKRITIILFL